MTTIETLLSQLRSIGSIGCKNLSAVSRTRTDEVSKIRTKVWVAESLIFQKIQYPVISVVTTATGNQTGCSSSVESADTRPALSQLLWLQRQYMEYCVVSLVRRTEIWYQMYWIALTVISQRNHRGFNTSYAIRSLVLNPHRFAHPSILIDGIHSPPIVGTLTVPSWT